MNGRTSRSICVDIAVTAVLVLVAALGLAPLYGGTSWLLPAVGGLVIGLAAAWVGASRRLPALTVLAMLLGAFLVLGSAVAVPNLAAAGFLPTLDSLRALVEGAVLGWRRVVTTTPPVGEADSLLALPLVATMLTAVLALSAALRLRRLPAVALVPPAVLLVVVALIGTGRDYLPVPQGVVLLGTGLTWAAWRRRQSQQASDAGSIRPLGVRALAGGAVLLLVATGTGAAGATAFAPEGKRYALREVVQPPFDPRSYASPLAAFRRYVKDLPDDVLFRLSGLPAGARIRLATLDTYDGVVWKVAAPGSGPASGEFARSSGRTDDPVVGQTARVTVEVGSYSGVWLPTVGQTTGVEFGGTRAADLGGGFYYNPATGTGLVTAGVQEGDRFVLDVVLGAPPAAAQVEGAAPAGFALPAPQQVAPQVASVASELSSGAETPGAQVQMLAQRLAKESFFSNGIAPQTPSRAGHGTDRIADLLEQKQRVGDQEQYASAMALMVRALGLPARVVMGFAPTGSGDVSVVGGDVSAWVEVAFAGLGWVVFDPTPDESQTLQEQAPKPKPEPKPQPEQPPPPTQELEPPPEADPSEQPAEEDKPGGRLVGLLVAALSRVVLPLAVLLAPFALLVALKVRRRSRRAGRGSPVERIAGGWAEVVDQARDLGTRPPARATRRETAQALQQVHIAASVALAERADAGVFAPGDPSEEEVAAFWAEVESALRGMTGEFGRWRRLRARLSPASLRRQG